MTTKSLSTKTESVVVLKEPHPIDFPEVDTLAISIAKVNGWSALFTSSAFSTYGAEAAAHVVAMVPIIIIFILMQKWFIRGLTDGILKM